MKNIGIIGHFGGNMNFCDGQTVKTKNVKSLLEDYGRITTFCVDTYLVKHHKILLFFKTILCLFKCRDIVILLSVNGMKFYLPFLYWVNKLFKRRIYHDIIGSELIEIVKENPKFVKYLNALEVNWFEYLSGAEQLKSSGVKNVEVLPNCKKIAAIPFTAITPYVSVDNCYEFCTFSRVTEAKGITDAIDAIVSINEKYQKTVVRLDIYGPIEEAYRPKFEKLIYDHSACISYKGIIDSQTSVDTLKKYYALLFPTKWPGEGFPGTILDSYSSALPVLATDWNANREIIINAQTGIIYPSEIAQDLSEAIEWSISNPDNINSMKEACRREYEKYKPEYISARIYAKILNK